MQGKVKKTNTIRTGKKCPERRPLFVNEENEKVEVRSNVIGVFIPKRIDSVLRGKPY